MPVASYVQFPMDCPVCKTDSGFPYMAGTVLHGGAINVGMRCRYCNHEWRYDMAISTDPKRESGIHKVVKPT